MTVCVSISAFLVDFTFTRLNSTSSTLTDSTLTSSNLKIFYLHSFNFDRFDGFDKINKIDKFDRFDRFDLNKCEYKVEIETFIRWSGFSVVFSRKDEL